MSSIVISLLNIGEIAEDIGWEVRTESPITCDLGRTVKQIPSGSLMEGVTGITILL